MLERMGRWVHRRRTVVLALWAVLVVAGAVLGGSVFDHAEDVGPRAGAESSVVDERLDALDTEGERVVALLSGADPVAPATSEAAGEVLFAIRELPGVVDVRDPWTTGAYELVAEDRSSAVVEVELDHALGDDEALALADRIADALRETPFPDVAVGGDLLAERTFTDQAVQDAARGEGAALVVLLVLLAVALGGLVAGVLPVVTALAAVSVSLLALAGLAGVASVSDFAVNVVTVLGLGLCVDYSLLVLARFREERAAAGRRADLEAVLGRTLATAGRTVLVSGVTVGSAVAALLLLGDPLLTGMAVGGLVAVAVVTTAGLTLTPALLSVAHRRVPAADRGAWGRPARPPERSVLARLARLAQARPWPVLVTTTGLLLVLAAPLLGLELGASDARSLPPGSEARTVVEVIERDYPDVATAPIDVLVDAPPDDPRLTALAEGMAALDDVEDVFLRDGLPDGWSRYTVMPQGTTSGPAAQRVVADVRALGDDVRVQVGGPAAELVDARAALAERAPLAVAAVVLVAGLLLLRLTGAPVVAAKTLLLNLLSLAAMLGVVTLVFQHGWGGPLLGGTATGSLDLTTPLLLFMFAFGLSMDYHVFLVARIKEEWDLPPVARRNRPVPAPGSRAANDRAVLAGITASGPVVTLAALAISVVFIGFAAGELVAVKEVGVGMTVAILLDVTVVRGLLLPAAMTLLGERNWWRPGG
ncbi:MMPL family transporter [Nocardioides sp. zg-1228]|uniref:MMPL family transporter n=1 Tax=Nocardioides sp. zg-1228 TaxID=2763008 RepID=UPI0016430CDC|nr:MMPL family transporter [Nocardioides sp. zg-1228]MBC2932469.1 MMPL family transporter [Nocardioides sp. zg-1228]QSF57976.1 MMPL family transporter [Nocardioides sp. zg-1228]